MSLVITVVHIMACIVLIVVVLLQRGKGAEMGAVFGGGGSNTVFGSRGATSFLSKLTTWCTVIFFITSLSLAYIASRSQSGLFHGVTDSSTDASPTGASQSAAETNKAPTNDAKAGSDFTEVPAAAPTTEDARSATTESTPETIATPSDDSHATAPGAPASTTAPEATSAEPSKN